MCDIKQGKEATSKEYIVKIVNVMCHITVDADEAIANDYWTQMTMMYIQIVQSTYPL
jgi:hypothetical protein